MRQFFNIRISFIILKKKTSFLYDSNVIHQLLYLIKTINGSSLYSLNGKIKNTVVFNFQVIQGGLNPIKLFHLFILLQKALDSPINESRLYRIPNPHNSLHFLKIAFHVFKVSHILSWREREPVGCPIPVIPASFLISPQFSNGLTNKWFLFFFFRFQSTIDLYFIKHRVCPQLFFFPSLSSHFLLHVRRKISLEIFIFSTVHGGGVWVFSYYSVCVVQGHVHSPRTYYIFNFFYMKIIYRKKTYSNNSHVYTYFEWYIARLAA